MDARIPILSKIPCQVHYGMGDEEFDKQARVALVEFRQVFVLITYHPQGGFTDDSLSSRARWEKRFTEFLLDRRAISMSIHSRVIGQREHSTRLGRSFLQVA